MNTNRLSLKDYIMIYFIIFLLVAFLGGFFLGAKVMESQIEKTSSITMKNNDKALVNKNEIINFYEQVYAPIIAWNKKVTLEASKINTLQGDELETLLVDGYKLKANFENYTFASENLTSALLLWNENLDLTLSILEKNNPELVNEAFDKYLLGQVYFYREIWLWEQTTNEEKNISLDSKRTWKVWNKASLHQKNYIVASLLYDNSIDTMLRPEDITVHIDNYFNLNKETTLKLDDVVQLLVNSEAIEEKAFLKYKDNYKNLITPEIPNFR